MKNKIKFVYFDLGDVVFKFDESLSGLSNKFELDKDDLMNVFLKYDNAVCAGEITVEELWNRYVEELGIKNVSDFDFLDFWVKNFKPITLVHNFIVDASSKCQVGLLTNIFPGVLDNAITYGSVPNIKYNAIVQSFECGCVKPDQQIYRYAEDKAGCSADEIVFIDNSPANLVIPEKMGWNVFLFNKDNPDETVQKVKLVL